MAAATQQDFTASNAAILAWQWLDESYAEFMEEDDARERDRLAGECRAYSHLIHYLTDVSPDDIRQTMKDRYERSDA